MGDEVEEPGDVLLEEDKVVGGVTAEESSRCV